MSICLVKEMWKTWTWRRSTSARAPGASRRPRYITFSRRQWTPRLRRRDLPHTGIQQNHALFYQYNRRFQTWESQEKKYLRKRLGDNKLKLLKSVDSHKCNSNTLRNVKLWYFKYGEEPNFSLFFCSVVTCNWWLKYVTICRNLFLGCTLQVDFRFLAGYSLLWTALNFIVKHFK